MTKLLMSELHKLSLKEKIELVQSLWDDIAEEQTFDFISEEHKKILDQRLKRINSGSAEFKSWSMINAKFCLLKSR